MGSTAAASFKFTDLPKPADRPTGDEPCSNPRTNLSTNPEMSSQILTPARFEPLTSLDKPCGSRVDATGTTGVDRFAPRYWNPPVNRGEECEMSSLSGTPWKQLLLSSIQAHTHLKHSSYFQLATISPNNTPSNRTVVFRGFQDNSDRILINTDARSGKAKHTHTSTNDLLVGFFFGGTSFHQGIKAKTSATCAMIDDLNHWPFAEICWYFTDSWEQFRISGHVEVIDVTNPDRLKLEAREKSWFASSLRSRVQYMLSSPGLPCLSEEPAPLPPLDTSMGPVDAFCLLVMDANQVDYLNLKSNKRVIFSSGLRSGVKFWVSEEVNP